MSKNISKKISIFIVICLLLIGVSTKFGFTYANDYELIKNEDIYLNTITDTMYNLSTEISKGPSKSTGKKAYITIDDGPSKYTDDIINTLNKHNAKATFFMIDRNMKLYPNQVKNIIENGNTPGFHSVSHDIHKLYKTNKSAKEEFDINRQTLLEVAGIESSVVRLPYGSKPYTPHKCYEELVEAGYKMWDWDIDTEDWKVSSDQALENVKLYSKGKDNIVVLMHEKKQTAKSLDRILRYLSEEVYEFVPIDESETPQNFWLKNFK